MPALSPEFSQYFRDLAANNDRDWFHANKKRYEQHVKTPFYELVADLIARLQERDPEVNLEVKNAVFRINRDIRFSNDKSPYKLHVGAVISRGGRKDMSDPGVYVQIEAERLMIAGGCYRPDKDELQKIREHIVRHPQKAEKLNADKTFRKYFPDGIGGERNKILPKEFKEYGDDIPMIFQKQYFWHVSYDDPKVVQREDLADFIMKHYDAAADWTAFLRDALKGAA